MPRWRQAGYTLVEIVVALVVFTTGALGLAAGSAIVTRRMVINGVRAEAGRLAASRQEIALSSCHEAQSGSEARGPITSVWSISRVDSFRVSLAGTVSYPGPRGIRAESYSATIRCE